MNKQELNTFLGETFENGKFRHVVLSDEILLSINDLSKNFCEKLGYKSHAEYLNMRLDIIEYFDKINNCITVNMDKYQFDKGTGVIERPIDKWYIFTKIPDYVKE